MRRHMVDFPPEPDRQIKNDRDKQTYPKTEELSSITLPLDQDSATSAHPIRTILIQVNLKEMEPQNNKRKVRGGRLSSLANFSSNASSSMKIPKR